MRLFLLTLLFPLAAVAGGFTAAFLAAERGFVPIVRDPHVCGEGVVVIFGLDSGSPGDIGIVTLPDDVVDVSPYQGRPIGDVLDTLYWQRVKPGPELGDAPIYGPILPNTGATRCLVEGADA